MQLLPSPRASAPVIARGTLAPLPVKVLVPRRSPGVTWVLPLSCAASALCVFALFWLVFGLGLVWLFFFQLAPGVFSRDDERNFFVWLAFQLASLAQSYYLLL